MTYLDGRAQAALLLALGGITLRLGLTDDALAFVKPSLQPALLAAGAMLLALGGHALLRAFKEPAPADHELSPGASDVHDDSHGPGVAWLLIAPLLALLLVAPPPLGSFAAARLGSVAPAATGQTFEPLPEPVDGAVALSLSEYMARSMYDTEDTLDGLRLRLTGFVLPSETPGTYLLARFVVNCCAADATPRSVEILGDGLREADTWLEVEGYWQPIDGHEPGTWSEKTPRMRIESVVEVEQPSQPYEY